MPTRLRKTRKFRGSRTHGWGQVAQHRASGHKGGLGVSGLLKHHFSTMLIEDPDLFGHSSTKPPHSNNVKKWIGVRDLDDLYVKYGVEKDGKKVINLQSLGFEKLLGGGSTNNAYIVKIKRFTKSASEKVKGAGGEVLTQDG